MRKIKYMILLIMVLCGCSNHKYAETDSRHSFITICIDGHEYYSGAYRLAIKLNDDGTPIKCKVEDDEK